MSIACAGKAVLSDQVASLETTVRKCQARMEQLCKANDKLTSERDAVVEQCTQLKIQRANADTTMAAQKQQVVELPIWAMGRVSKAHG